MVVSKKFVQTASNFKIAFNISFGFKQKFRIHAKGAVKNFALFVKRLITAQNQKNNYRRAKTKRSIWQLNIESFQTQNTLANYQTVLDAVLHVRKSLILEYLSLQGR